MLMDGIDASTAAYEVGYESVSQFTREYSRVFGQPPMRDIKAIRNLNIVSTNQCGLTQITLQFQEIGGTTRLEAATS